MYTSWVEISKSAILHNLQQYKNIVGSASVMPIVKSNAYGHGMIEIAKLVSDQVDWIGVVSLGEALELRRQGIDTRIFILTYAPSDFIEEGVKQSIAFPVYDYNYAKKLSEAAVTYGMDVKVHLKLDTGTTRVGVLPGDFVSFAKQVAALPGIVVEGIYSHFAASEDDYAFTKKQASIFRETGEALRAEGLDITHMHIACSAAMISLDDSIFTMTRLGLSLYGLWPSSVTHKAALSKYPDMSLIPALSWKTNVLQVKDIKKGTKIGYGCTYEAESDMTIAIVAVGYWEGYRRGLSNKSDVLIGGKRSKVLGVICMNIMMVDVTNNSVSPGDEVTLLGVQGSEEITAEELADLLGTINYEVVTQINPLLERRYVK